MRIFLKGLLLAVASVSFSETMHVGPGRTYATIGDALQNELGAGDSVVIHARSEPYCEKWVIAARGTESRPVVFHGVPDQSGNPPVIDGRDAVTPVGMNFWSEDRGVIKIGGSNNPPDTTPSRIIIENLEIRNASEPFSFTGRNGTGKYGRNAAAIYIEKGRRITIRNCILHGCGNGLFAAHQAKSVLVEHCHLYDNGNDGSIYEHNSYTESFGITFQFNRFGPLRDGALGNNLKDRSAGCIVRYNWIESGNRQLDLVESGHPGLYDAMEYRSTFVYGNLLIEPDGAGNSQIVHYGGDGGDQSRYRKGMLYFYNNTVVSTRSGNTTLLRLSTTEEAADVRNNIVYVSAEGSRLAVLNSAGTVHLHRNWMNAGRRTSHSNESADVREVVPGIEGGDPGFADLSTLDLSLSTGSACIDNGIAPASPAENYPVTFEYARHREKRTRTRDGTMDLGAREFRDAGAILTRSRAREVRGNAEVVRLINIHGEMQVRGGYNLLGRKGCCLEGGGLGGGITLYPAPR